MNKQEIISSFDPNAQTNNKSLFGLPFDEHTSDLIIIGIPWEATVSYHSGTSKGPKSILEASYQVDLNLKDIQNAWSMGIHMLPINYSLLVESNKMSNMVKSYLNEFNTQETRETKNIIPNIVNDISSKLNLYIKNLCKKHLTNGKMVGLVGGDHSTALGIIQAMNDLYPSFGILQIDAHADLRDSYQNFEYSHASIMYNALHLENISKLVQVGIRDYCDEELEYIETSNGRIVTYFDDDIKSSMYLGETWDRICNDIINNLPTKVYISFDIDGLDPVLCPNTGTPVPGGLSFTEAIYLIKKIVGSKKTIIGFDINEVSPGENDWDANVGARLLYQLSSWMGVSQGKLFLKS